MHYNSISDDAISGTYGVVVQTEKNDSALKNGRLTNKQNKMWPHELAKCQNGVEESRRADYLAWFQRFIQI